MNDRFAMVLGNGPALIEDGWFDEDHFRIGVNRSFNVMWAPIGVTADPEAYRVRHSHKFQPVSWLYRDDFTEAPYWTKGNSGAFGMWIAFQMGFNVIKLVGFGGTGHFYASDDTDRTENDRKLHQGIAELQSNGFKISGKLPPVPENVVWGKMRAI